MGATTVLFVGGYARTAVAQIDRAVATFPSVVPLTNDVQQYDAWIETIADDEGERTSWTVRLSGKTLTAGATLRDPSGVQAFEQARAWAQQNARGVAFTWKHRRDAAGGIGSSLADS